MLVLKDCRIRLDFRQLNSIPAVVSMTDGTHLHYYRDRNSMLQVEEISPELFGWIEKKAKCKCDG